MLAPSTTLPRAPASVTMPSFTVTVRRSGSVKNMSAITSWVISRLISSSGRLNTLSTSARLTMPTRRPPASITGSRLSLCEDIRRATLLTSSSGLVATTGRVMRSPAVSVA
jgi:hypothetical protein